MKFFDPQRNLIGDIPTYTDQPYALPGFYIEPEPDGRFTMSVWLSSSDNAFSCKSKLVKPVELISLLMRYLADPEGVLKSDFNWTPTKREVSTLTFADLGL